MAKVSKTIEKLTQLLAKNNMTLQEVNPWTKLQDAELRIVEHPLIYIGVNEEYIGVSEWHHVEVDGKTVERLKKFYFDRKPGALDWILKDINEAIGHATGPAHA